MCGTGKVSVYHVYFPLLFADSWGFLNFKSYFSHPHTILGPKKKTKQKNEIQYFAEQENFQKNVNYYGIQGS